MKEKECIIGLDLSINGTGIAILSENQVKGVYGFTTKVGLQKQFKSVFSLIKYKKNTSSTNQDKIALVFNFIDEIICRAKLLYDKMYVAIEGYAFSAISRGLTSMAELAGCVKSTLWFHNIPYRIYDPLSVKLAATGKGHAEKSDMIIAAKDYFPDAYDILNDINSADEAAASNIADSLLLAWLLQHELNIRCGKTRLEDAEKNVRAVMLRTTNSNPVAIISDDFIEKFNVNNLRIFKKVEGEKNE